MKLMVIIELVVSCSCGSKYIWKFASWPANSFSGQIRHSKLECSMSVKAN